MSTRLEVTKTFKLYIDGKFPRSESGRSMVITHNKTPIHVCKASRKDYRDAVEAARKAQPGWAASTAYLRGQILYRIAEMLEGKRDELIALSEPDAPARVGRTASKGARSAKTPRPQSAAAEIQASIDRLISYAGWADKYAQVLGCNNPVSGPFYNFTVPEPTGVVTVIAPDAPALLGLVSLLAPAICSGNTAICIASQTNPLPALVLAEACATGDVPAGVVNILSAERAELLKVIAGHRDTDAVLAANLSAAEAAMLKEGVAENLKRVTVRDVPDWYDSAACNSPWWIEPMVEMKTIWHPASV